MTTLLSPKAIKLRAEDADDLKIISACLQDAIVPLPEVGYLPDARTFVMVVNRFKWERVGEGGSAPYQRTNCAVSVLGVTAVRRRRIDLLNPATVLNLLTITPSDEGLDLIFAGDSAIHLTAPHWRCLVEDIGEPWPTAKVPHHPAEEAETGA